jgi:FKBP-type peptidyl-prolyl cis-trans isomerase FkpA
MRFRAAAVLALLSAFAPLAAAAPADPTLASDEAKIAYAVGLTIWKNLEPLALTPEEIAVVQRALADAAAGREPAIDYAAWAPKIKELSQARAAERVEREKARGRVYLERAATEPGAVRTDSGMVYRELVAGSGRNPKASSTVEVHYRGTLVDGTPFDSSYDRGKPIRFGLGQVVECWSEGLQRMKPGGRAVLVCPSDLAYGDGGRPSIPGGATLVFEVELLSFD